MVKIVTADQCEIAEISGKTHHERWTVVEDCLVNHGQVLYVKESHIRGISRLIIIVVR